MATRALVGWESGSLTSEVGTANHSGTVSLVTSPTAGAWSTYALRVNPTTTNAGTVSVYCRSASTGVPLQAEVSGTVSYCRFNFRVDTLPASNYETIAIFQTAVGTNKLYLVVKSDGALAVYDPTGPTLIATGTAVLSLATWYRVETKIGVGVGAVIETRVNGTVDISTTATLSALENGPTTFGKINLNGNSVDFFYDDIRISDSAYPGEGQCSMLIPDADGASQAFSIGAGSGSHYQIVDNVPPDTAFTTSYLVSTAQNDAETEAMQPASTKSISSSINCVLPFAYLRRNASTTTALGRLVSGGNNYDSASASQGSTPVPRGILYDTDPATSAPWTTSGIDAAQVGCVDDNASNRIRMSAAFLMVDWTPASPPPPPAAGYIQAPLLRVG